MKAALAPMYWQTRSDTAGTTSWSVGRDADGSRRLMVDRQSIRLDDVATVSQSTSVERDLAGKLVVLVTFGGAAVVLLLGVLAGWRSRFLAGAGLLGMIGLASGLEALWAGRIVMYRVDLAAPDGHRLRFATASPVERDAFLLAVGAGPVGVASRPQMRPAPGCAT